MAANAYLDKDALRDNWVLSFQGILEPESRYATREEGRRSAGVRCNEVAKRRQVTVELRIRRLDGTWGEKNTYPAQGKSDPYPPNG